MEIIPIFDDKVPQDECRLFSAWFPEDDDPVFDTLFYNWQDTEFLVRFFQENLENLSEKWPDMSLDKAVKKAQIEALLFRRKLECIEIGHPDYTGVTFDNVFTPLSNNVHRMFDSKMKAYPYQEGMPFLRLYAVSIGDGCYIVAGGGIKVVKSMQDSPDLEFQRLRLNRVQDHLKDINFDPDLGFIEP